MAISDYFSISNKTSAKTEAVCGSTMTTQSPVFPTLLITEQVVKSNSFPSSALRSQGHLPSLNEMRWRMPWMCFKDTNQEAALAPRYLACPVVVADCRK